MPHNKHLGSVSDKELLASTPRCALLPFDTIPRHRGQNSFNYGLWMAELPVFYAAIKPGRSINIAIATLNGRQLGYTLNPSATFLLLIPSCELHIAHCIMQRSTDFSRLQLRKGCFGGEVGAANPSTRAEIEAGLGIDAYDYYGFAEIGLTFAIG